MDCLLVLSRIDTLLRAALDLYCAVSEGRADLQVGLQSQDQGCGGEEAQSELLHDRSQRHGISDPDYLPPHSVIDQA